MVRKSKTESEDIGSAPKIRKRETKTRSRLFRFTETKYKHLLNLAERYDADVSKIMDLLIEVSTLKDFRKALDRYVAERGPT